MKIMLIYPPYETPFEWIVETPSPPLGLAYLASMVRGEHEVKIIDSNALAYDINDIKRELRGFDPDLVGIAATTPIIYKAYELARAVKEINRDSMVVLGGPHPTFMHREVLEKCWEVDVVVRGEGELTFKELVECIDGGRGLDGVKGITFRRDDGEIIENPPRGWIMNLDEVPFPSRDLLPLDKYSYRGIRFTTMLTSRGCPYRCIFCSSSRLVGGFWRGRSAGNVLREMREIYEDYGIRHIEIVDDTFTLHQSRVEEICDGIIREGWDLRLMASSRVDLVTERLAKKMRRAGFTTIYLGIESGNQGILDRIGKRITIRQIKKAVTVLKEAGIEVVGSFILGFLEDTVETIKETVRLAKSLDIDYAQFSILTPYPGTPLYDYCRENGLLATEDWSRYTALEPVIRLKSLSEEKLISLLKKAYISFYLRPKILLRWLRKGRLGLVKNATMGLLKYLKERISFIQ